jgi:alpha/beta superfamily hydrolase
MMLITIRNIFEEPEMSEQSINITVDNQIYLVGGFTATPGTPRGSALITHPHPLYGGSMHNNVVEALVSAASEAGWSALRFNFRGVGGSSGSHDNGQGEQDDVIAAASWLQERSEAPLVLLGYSFGSLVAAHAASRLSNLIGGVWVAPPLILGDLPPWPQDAGPLLMIAGTKDEFTNVLGLNSYVTDMGARGTLQTLEDADHFFWGEESALIERIAPFLSGLSE